MNRIDFYTNVPDKIAYACRLVRKARAARCRVVLLTRNAAQMSALDSALWAFSATDFLPHVGVHDLLAPLTPIILACSDQEEMPHHEILVNLSDTAPACVARFERMLEIIETDAADIQRGRERYLLYKKQRYPLEHIVVESA